jgi:hypothetical protein
MVEMQIKQQLEANNYHVKCINTQAILIDPDFPPSLEDKDIKIIVNKLPAIGRRFAKCYALNWDNIVTPKTFETMGKYGIIYIGAHGGPANYDEDNFDVDNIPPGMIFRLSCTIVPRDSEDPKAITPIDEWIANNPDTEFEVFKHDPPDPLAHNHGWWYYRDRSVTGGTIGSSGTNQWVRELALTQYYFDYLNYEDTTNFDGSLIYWGGCYAWHMKSSFSSAKVFIGYHKYGQANWAYPFAYDFFYFMMYGTKGCPQIDNNNGGKLKIPGASIPTGTPSFDPNAPLHAEEALYTALRDYYKVNPDPAEYPPGSDDALYCAHCEARIQLKDPNEHVYFPVPVEVTIEKK